MSEHLSSLPEHRTPSDRLWLAVNVIEDMAHTRKRLSPHSPFERVRLIHQNVFGHAVYYDLDYMKQEDKLYWPRLVVHTPAIHNIEWFEQRDDEKVKCVPHSLGAPGNDPVVFMAEKLLEMQHLMQRGGRGIEWQLVKGSKNGN
jgi:hypothetical protein